MNLTKMSDLARKIIVGGAVFLIMFFVMKAFLIPMGKIAFNAFFPPKDPPNPIYGKLASPVFIQKKIQDAEPKYSLDTKTGKLPSKLPNKMTVYKIAPAAFSYEAGKKAFETAAYLGFLETDLSSDLKGDTYIWRSNTLGRELEIQIGTDNLSLSTNTANKTTNFLSGELTDDSIVKEEAVKFLEKTGRYNDSMYKEGTQKVKYGKFSNQKIVETDNPLEAQFAKIEFYRAVNEIPVYGPDIDEGLISIVIGGNDTLAFHYVNARSKISGINTQSNATYPIVPVNQVWAAVQQNKGVIASVNPEEQSDFGTYTPVRIDEILISEIELAYYESTDPQKYLQPIYVFKGFYSSSNSKGSIAIYYPAISAEYVLAETP